MDSQSKEFLWLCVWLLVQEDLVWVQEVFTDEILEALTKGSVLVSQILGVDFNFKAFFLCKSMCLVRVDLFRKDLSHN